MRFGEGDHSVNQNNTSALPAAPIMGTGEMAELIRTHDWAATSLGPLRNWSKELVTVVNLMLCSPTAARVLWGPEFILLYNDEYRPIPGRRHPEALGKPAQVVYAEAWHVVGPLLEAAYAIGQTSYHEKLPVPLETADGVQDFYLNYSYSPVYEDGKIAGVFGALHDVTAEVLATRKLRESELRVSRILHSIGDAVIVTDAEGCIQRMNPVAESLTGWTLDQAKGLPLESVFRIRSEETGLPVESPAQKVKRLGAIVGLANHTILIARNGRQIHIDDSGAPIRNDDGEPTGIVLVFRDINERRAAEQERVSLMQQLNQVLETTTDAILSVDRTWRITYMNTPAKAVIAPIRNIVGKGFWESFPDVDYPGSPFVEHLHRAMHQATAETFEAYYRGPLNIWIQVNVRPSHDGIVLFFRDVTEEKRAAALLQQATDALKSSEEELRWTIDLSAQIPWTADTQGRILNFSDSWLALTGLSRESALGEGWAQVPHPEDLPRMSVAWRHSLETGKPCVIEHRVRTASGEYRWMRSSAYARHNEAGEIIKWYGTTEDIDDRKRAEVALIQSEKLAAVGRLASSIAHEINNPLESVTNLIYLARQNALLPEVQGFLDDAERELRRVSAITNQTLRFHKQSTHRRSMLFDDLLESVLTIYQGRLQNAHVQVEKLFRTAVSIKCFEGEIRQVLSNLIGNSIDAMHQGGRLLLRTRQATHWKTAQQGVILTVADNGSGMDRQTQRRIFDAFFTTKDIGGTGLGLWISKEIVDRHEGSLSVRSSQRAGSSGTVFQLFLPFDHHSTRETPPNA